mgnify:CR=1 FL=1
MYGADKYFAKKDRSNIFLDSVKINGEKVPLEFVYNFIDKYKDKLEEVGASYFEITTALAFDYFAASNVDIAIIECGLGGRLDSTNIITPLVSVITNIGLDHCEHLGYTLPQIASEKAGIIKKDVPVVVGEAVNNVQVKEVFEKAASQKGCRIYFAEEFVCNNDSLYNTLSSVELDLKGDCQQKNLKTVFTALCALMGKEKVNDNIGIIKDGVANAARNTQLMGRWQKLQSKPLVICDTAHNSHGFRLLGPQIQRTYQMCKDINANSKLHVIFGVVADKDLNAITDYLPKEQAQYFYVNAQGERALKAGILKEKMQEYGFRGDVCCNGDIAQTIKYVLESASLEDFIFIGGSTFVVAEALKFYKF